MQMVIPCGGLATRLGDLSKKIPKSMMDINGKPFLEYQIDLIKNYNFYEIVLCIGHLGHKIKNYFGDGSSFDINIKYSCDENLGVIGAVKNAESLLEGVFFMMYGDSYLPYLDFDDMASKFEKQEKAVMMAVWKNNDYLDKSNLKIEDKNLIGVNANNSNYIDYGVSVIDKDILREIPDNKKYSTKKFREMLFNKNELGIYKVYKRFYHIGNPESLKEFKEYIKSR